VHTPRRTFSSVLSRVSLRAVRGPTLLVGAGVATVAFAGPPMRYAEDRAPAIVNPVFATTMSEARIDELIFEGLFSDDQELKSAPRLAENVTLAADKKSGIVNLRPNITWHDGQAFTADDVVFTIDAMKDPATASTESGRVNWIKRAVALDARRLQLEFVNAEYAPEDKLHFKILPKHKFSGTALKRTDPFRTSPVGTGPFKLDGFNGDNSVSLQAFDGWHGTVGLTNVEMREVADKNYQAKLLLYESLEALVRVLPREVATLQNDRKVELYPYQTNSWWYLGFNMNQKRFQDVKVRKAIHQMIDVEALLDPIGTGDVLSGPFVKSSPFYNHEVAVQKQDQDAAKATLESAGYVLNGRQWMKGTEVLTVRVAAPENLETAQDVVINLQSQLQAQGIVVEPTFLGVADWRQKVWKDKDFDIILSQWSFDRNEDIYEQFYSKGIRNFGGYKNPEVDKLLDKARAGVDPQEKKALLRQVHAKIAADDPMVFLWSLDSYAAMSTKVKNVVVHPFYFFTWANEWSM
jgi:peptide/nickel transport system substrate-binding protein